MSENRYNRDMKRYIDFMRNTSTSMTDSARKIVHSIGEKEYAFFAAYNKLSEDHDMSAYNLEDAYALYDNDDPAFPVIAYEFIFTKFHVPEVESRRISVDYDLLTGKITMWTDTL